MVQLKAIKMANAKVSHISLVERGANRTPFKITKSDHSAENPTMKIASLDLGRLFQAKKAETPAELVAVLTMKGDGLASVRKLIEEAGFVVKDETAMQDDSIVFKQDGEMEGDAVVIRMSDDVALVCKGFSPYNMDMSVDGLSFADKVAAQGFYPSISTVMDVVRSSIYDTVAKADTPADASAAIGAMMGEVSKYAASLVSNLPSKAFKLEGAVSSAYSRDGYYSGGIYKGAGPENEEEDPTDDKDVENESEETDDVTKDDESAEVMLARAIVAKADGTVTKGSVPASFKKHQFTKGGDDATKAKDNEKEGMNTTDDAQKAIDMAKAKMKSKKTPAMKADDPKEKDNVVVHTPDDKDGDKDESGGEEKEYEPSGDDKDVHVEVDVKKSVDEMSALLVGKMGELFASFKDEVSTKINEISDRVTEVSDAVAKSDQATEKVSKALAGITVMGSDADDTDPNPVVRKRENAIQGREIDTAFMPRSMRTRR